MLYVLAESLHFVSVKRFCVVFLFDALVGRHAAVLCLHKANLSTPMD